MLRKLFILLLLLTSTGALADHGGTVLHTPYTSPKVVFDFYLDSPHKMGLALNWIRTLTTTLTGEPYNQSLDYTDIKVVIHGTELVTLAAKNYDQYADTVDRLRYYADLGVEFKVCALAADQFGYLPTDFQDFVQIVPSSIAELIHWQMQGYALVSPSVPEKLYSIEEIR